MEEPMQVDSGPGADGANKKKKTQKIVVDNPSLDLEQYIANYSGHGRVDRLLFIADHAPSLAVDAYRLALADLKKTMNAPKYLATASKLNDLLAHRGLPTQSADHAWADQTQRLAKQTTDRLEAELKNYKNNHIKESIRMGHNDLGNHYYAIGDLSNALKSFSRTRDYAATARHTVDMSLSIIKVSVELGNWSHIDSYAHKASTSATDDRDKAQVQAKCRCAVGLAHLDAGKYKAAGKSFTEVGFELKDSFNDVLSPNDVATYGGLCALASFDRSEVKRAMENPDFRQFLELEPQVRELVHSFYNSKYAACLKLMEKLKNDLLLDPYLHPHVESLYQHVRRRMLAQYLSPFLTVSLHSMARAFATTVERLEPEVAGLIVEGVVKGRIDSHNKVLHARRADQRSAAFERALSLGADYERQVRHALVRMRLVRAELYVRAPSERPERGAVAAGGEGRT